MLVPVLDPEPVPVPVPVPVGVEMPPGGVGIVGVSIVLNLLTKVFVVSKKQPTVSGRVPTDGSAKGSDGYLARKAAYFVRHS